MVLHGKTLQPLKHNKPKSGCTGYGLTGGGTLESILLHGFCFQQAGNFVEAIRTLRTQPETSCISIKKYTCALLRTLPLFGSAKSLLQAFQAGIIQKQHA